MNKIIIDNDITSLDNNEYNIEIKNENIVLNISGNVVINDIDNSNCNIIINMEDDSYLIYYKYNENDLSKCNITVNQNNNCNCRFNYSLIANNDVELMITNNISGDNNVSNICFRSINRNGNVSLVATGVVKKDTHNNSYIEDLKGLSVSDRMIEMKPELLIDSEDVEANHLMVVSNVRESDLFYLQSKGLDKGAAIKLLENGFINAILPEDLRK